MGESGAIQSSSDEISWSARPSGTASALTDAVFAGGRFVAVGDRGTILQSAPTFPSLCLRKVGGGSEINLVGGFDRSYVLETSGDVTSGTWIPLTTLAPAHRQFTDPDPAADRKFYRLTLP